MQLKSISLTDDDPTWLIGLSKAIRNKYKDTTLKLNLSAAELIGHSKTLKTELVIIDYKMPQIDGIQSALLLRADNYNGKIMIVSSGFSKKIISEMDLLKIDCYCEKKIQIVLDGISQTFEHNKDHKNNDFESWEIRTKAENLGLNDCLYFDKILNNREKTILLLVIKGLKNSSIASQLGIGEKTIEACLTKLFEKLGMNKKQLIMWGAINGLTESESILQNNGKIG